MLKNYFKIAIRNLLKYKMFSFINIFGLAVAMSVCLLIILMLADQTSYDEFHRKKDRIYRILSKRKDIPIATATSPFPLAGMLEVDYPFIEKTTQLVMGIGGDVSYNERTTQMRGFFAEPDFFEMFTYEFERGDRHTALASPNSIVLTKEAAQLLFGSEDPIGKTVEFVDRGLLFIDLDFVVVDKPPKDWGNFTITGVLAKKDYKTHLKFDALVSSSSLPALQAEGKIEDLSDNWKNHHSCYTYVLLKPEAQRADLTAALDAIAAEKYSGIERREGSKLIAQKLTKITPGPFVGNPSSFQLPLEAYYFLSLLALVIMMSACLNYTNLCTARALTRAKEIGVRKVTGARRNNLVAQFLSESIVTALLALAAAIGLLVVIKPAFMGLWLNQFMNVNLQSNWQVYGWFAAFAVFVGLLAGVFPAVTLSKYQPVKVFKNIANNRPGKLGLRKFLNVSQFVVSLFFIITSLLIYKQFQHFLRFEYGFTSQNIVNIELQGNDHRLVSNELRSVPGVATVSACEFLPATAISNELNLRKVGEEEAREIHVMHTDEHFIENLDLTLVAGRNLPPAGESSDGFILVNETATKEFGYENPSEMIGEQFILEGGEQAVQVIGVLADFRFQSPMFADKIGALMLQNKPDEFSFLNVKIVSGDLRDTISKLREEWNSIDPIHPFKYHFFDDQIALANQLLGDLLSILGFIAFLAVTIACLGLLGMATYTTERRRKEVGIRKVLGAEDFKLALLLSKEFLKVLVISILIAVPLSYFANNAWLQNFPNRVEFGLGTPLLGSAILLALGLLTIGSQSIRAARSNPVESLRME